MINKIVIKAICIFKLAKLKNWYWKNAPYINIINKNINNAFLSKLNGLHTLYRWINPVVPVKNTARALTISSDKLKACSNKTINMIFKNTVTPAGILFLNIFKMKFPDTIFVFGSRARINEGIPIVHVVIRVNWIGIKKYSERVNKQVKIIKIV